MRKGYLGSLAALLLGVGLAQAQWGPGPYGYQPPQYMQPYPGGYNYMPTYGGYAVQQAGEPEPGTPTQPAESGPSTAAPAQSGAAASCGPNCNPPPPPPAASSHTPALHDFVSDAERGPCLRYWITAEYLYWWSKPMASTVPLATTGSTANVTNPGAIGQPDTSILFGGSDINLPATSGFRLTVGGWLDNDNKFGLEANGFILGNQVVNFSNSTSAVLAVPISVVGPTFPNGPGAVPIQNPNFGIFNPLASGSANAAALPTFGPYVGSINVSVASQLWGAEFNGYYNLFRHCGLSLDVLGGLRYLNLQESMSLNATSTDTTLLITNTFNDSFQTGNQFWGGQIGLRGEWDYCRWSVQGTLKAAFGVNNETVTINGSSSQTQFGTTTNYVGGIFTQPSNIGSYRQTSFSFVPSVNLKIGYDLTPNMRFFVGYDFLYWTNVARATNQLDGTINPSQAYGGTLAGPVNPAPMINQTNYYAQGASLGIMFRY